MNTMKQMTSISIILMIPTVIASFTEWMFLTACRIIQWDC
jgi:hypothetical protein